MKKKLKNTIDSIMISWYYSGRSREHVKLNERKTIMKTLHDRKSAAKRFNGIKIVKRVPEGYIENNNATTTPIGYKLFFNGKSLFSGKRNSVLVANFS